MESTNVIPIVMVSDDNFVLQTRVAIWSMRKATDLKSLLSVTILCSAELDVCSRQVLMELQDNLQNLTIVFYEVDTKNFSSLKTIGHIPVTSYYRLMLSEILDEDVCLFLDGDIIINVDLNQIYSVDIDHYYVAGVKELGFLQDPEKSRQHMEKFGFVSLDTYVNAGVMLFNLAEIRKYRLQDKFMQELERQYTYMDQDIINKVCYGKIKLLEPKYNVPACHVIFEELHLDGDITVEQIEEAAKNWKILHFLGGYKPWEYVRTWGAKVWWQYAREALDERVWKPMYEYALGITNKSDWSYILDRCSREEEIIIVCYYDIGRDVYDSLIRCGIHACFYFCDNAKDKQELSYKGIEVRSITEMAAEYKIALWLNTSQANCRQINRQLAALGIDEERIVTYKYKSSVYYEMLDGEFREYEHRQFKLKNSGKV